MAARKDKGEGWDTLTLCTDADVTQDRALCTIRDDLDELVDFRGEAGIVDGLKKRRWWIAAFLKLKEKHLLQCVSLSLNVRLTARKQLFACVSLCLKLTAKKQLFACVSELKQTQDQPS